MNQFEQFDKNFDLAGLQQDIKEAAERTTPSYDKVPFGEYEVKVAQCELRMTKNNPRPMVSTWLKIVNGDKKGQLIFSNNVLIAKDPSKTGFMIRKAQEFLESLDTGVDCTFESFAQFENVCLDVAEAAEGLEYHISYYEDNKGYEHIEVKEVFEA